MGLFSRLVGRRRQEVSPPAPLPPRVSLGTYDDRGKRQHFIIEPRAGLRSHKLVAGITGSGKSMGLASFVSQCLFHGIPFLLIDPHSDTGKLVLQIAADNGYFNRPDAFQKLLYLDFTREGHAVPFNVLQQRHPPHALAELVMEAFRRAFPTSDFAAALESVMLNGLIVLIYNQRPITDMPRLLTEDTFRDGLLRRVPDAQVRSFWQRFDESKTSQTTASAERRLALLTYHPQLRGSLGASTNLLEPQTLMNEGVSVICDVGGLNGAAQRLIASFVNVSFEQGAPARRTMAEGERGIYLIVCDEWSQVAPGSEQALENILDRTRKFGLFIVAAIQHTSQLGHLLHGALQNCDLLAYRLGDHDAAWAATRLTEYDPEKVKRWGASHPVYYSRTEQRQLTEDALQQLAPGEAIVRIGNRIQRVSTLRVAQGQRDITPLLDRYAHDLLVPIPPLQWEADAGDDTRAAPRNRPVQLFEEDDA